MPSPLIRRFVLFCLLTLPLLPLQAQNVSMPKIVKRAYDKGTRTMDGKPGKNYWQNTARYTINITATPPSRTIQGTEEITYINNSPDTLQNIVVKLLLNVHKPGAIRRGGPASPDYLTSGMHIDRYAENAVTKPWADAGSATWKPVTLTKPLMPRDSIRLSFDWHVDVSKQSGREGALDSTTFFLAYFYPRVAVYDDYYGWDRTDFTEPEEFYNDFNDYVLNVTVPKNYLVWATGNLQNADEVLQPTYAQRLRESMLTDSVVNVATLPELMAGNVTRSQTNTWRWQYTNISDMALCLSDHYVWDASSVVVDKATGRRASVQAAFLDNAKDFHQMVRFGRHGLEWLSNNLPGVPYPFPKTTIVQGFAGMEYPMMVNDETYSALNFSRFVAEHELAHSWFPFYMGINEVRYKFMEEGWTTAFEYLLNQVDMGNEVAANLFKQFRVNRWARDLSGEQNVPIITPANTINGAAAGTNGYGKSAVAYLALKDLLGDALFKTSLHEFMNRWHGKHPTPWDMFFSFSDASGRNLNWFWNNWFFSSGYIDYAIQQVASSSKQCTVTIQNIGGLVAPVDVVLTFTDGTRETVHQTPAIWQTNQAIATVTIPTKKKVESVRLEGGIYVDSDSGNNTWPGK